MNIIINIWRSVFRYKLTASFFIIGQVIMYVTIFGALGIYNKAYQKEADRLAAQYKSRTEMDVTSLNKSDILSVDREDITEGNVIAKNISLFYAERKSNNRRPEIILADNENIPYELVSGRLPGTQEDDEGKRLVALGRAQYEYAYEMDGKYYATFENESYEVVGIIGNSGSDYLDNTIVFDKRCLGDNVMSAVMNMSEYTIFIGSNYSDINETYAKVYNNIIRKDKNAAIESTNISGEGRSTVAGTLKRENVRINIIVYIFCIVNCMLMSEFWIIERKKEFAIKRTYGYSQLRIIGGIARDIIALGGTSLIIYAACHIIAVNVLRIRLYTINWNMGVILSVIFINATSLIFTMIVPVYRIMRLNPAVILEDKE